VNRSLPERMVFPEVESCKGDRGREDFRLKLVDANNNNCFLFCFVFGGTQI
jgi:hypothetical protein